MNKIFGTMICLNCGSQRIITHGTKKWLIEVDSGIRGNMLCGMDKIADCCKSPDYGWRGILFVEERLKEGKIGIKKARKLTLKELNRIAPHML